MRFCLILKDGHKKVVLNLNSVFCLLFSLSKLVNFGFFNIHKIFYNNKNKILYNKRIKEILTYTKKWKTSCFFFHPFKLIVFTTHLKQINDNMYEWPSHSYKTLDLSKLSFTIWHKRLGYLNFILLKQHLHKLKINYIDDFTKYVYDSYQHAKTTKIYNCHDPQN